MPSAGDKSSQATGINLGTGPAQTNLATESSKTSPTKSFVDRDIVWHNATAEALLQEDWVNGIYIPPVAGNPGTRNNKPLSECTIPPMQYSSVSIETDVPEDPMTESHESFEACNGDRGPWPTILREIKKDGDDTSKDAAPALDADGLPPRTRGFAAHDSGSDTYSEDEHSYYDNTTSPHHKFRGCDEEELPRARYRQHDRRREDETSEYFVIDEFGHPFRRARQGERPVRSPFDALPRRHRAERPDRPPFVKIPQMWQHGQSITTAQELATYTASANYIVSMAGPPLRNREYGIVIVRRGEEDQFLSASVECCDELPPDLIEEVYAKDKQAKAAEAMTEQLGREQRKPVGVNSQHADEEGIWAHQGGRDARWKFRRAMPRRHENGQSNLQFWRNSMSNTPPLSHTDSESSHDQDDLDSSHDVVTVKDDDTRRRVPMMPTVETVTDYSEPSTPLLSPKIDCAPDSPLAKAVRQEDSTQTDVVTPLDTTLPDAEINQTATAAEKTNLKTVDSPTDPATSPTTDGLDEPTSTPSHLKIAASPQALAMLEALLSAGQLPGRSNSKQVSIAEFLSSQDKGGASSMGTATQAAYTDLLREVSKLTLAMADSELETPGISSKAFQVVKQKVSKK